VVGAAASAQEVRDLATGEVSNVAAPALTKGNVLYGRVVPVRAEPPAAFVLPPLIIDRPTARRVIRAVTRRAPVVERLRAVATYQRRAAEVAA
jgi:hypothetical protein